MKRTGRWITFLTLAAIAGGGYWFYQNNIVASAKSNVPVAPVREGDFLELVNCRGELVARKSVQLTAPVNVPDMRIVWMAQANAPVKAGDVVIRFDASSGRQQLAEKTASLEQANATLEQAEAQARITMQQDVRDTGAARHQVEKARLDVSKAEIVSRLQAEESRVDLSLAREKFNVQQATNDLHKASDGAKVASVSRVQTKAKSEVDLTNLRLSQMEVRSPGSGVIVFLTNYSQGWMNAKPFKVGDRVWPGSSIAEIPDLSTLEIKGTVEETDRGRIMVGQRVRIRVDALAEKTFDGELASISPLTEQNFEWPPTRNFRAFARITSTDEKLRPGMNGKMDVVVNTLKGALSIPSKAVFALNGKAVAYVAEGNRFRAVPVDVAARNADEVAVKGLRAGQSVATVEPPAKFVIAGGGE